MNSKQDFTEGSLPSKMAAFMLPIFGALVLQAMYSAVDMIIVGRFGTTAGISGVSTGSSVTNIVTFTLCGLTTGVTVLIGRYLGERQPERVGRLIGGSTMFFAAAALAVTVLLELLARPIAVLMQAPAEALDLTVLYIRICGAGFLFITMYNFISSLFRGMGNSSLPLLFVGIACVANIIGDLLLVAVLKMNVAGAAIATVAAQGLSVVLSLAIIRKYPLPFQISKGDFRFNSEIPAFLKVGAPLALQEFLTELSFMAMLAFINRMGLEASSGYGVAQKIQSFIMLIPSTLMQSVAPVVAQNVGACREDRARAATRFGICAGGCIGLFITAFIFLRGDLAAGIFTTDPAVVQNAFDYLRGFAADAILTCVAFSLIGYFNGHSDSLFVMLQGLGQSFLVRLPVSWWTSTRPGASLTTVGYSAPLSTIFGIVVMLLYLRKAAPRYKRLYGGKPADETPNG